MALAEAYAGGAVRGGGGSLEDQPRRMTGIEPEGAERHQPDAPFVFGNPEGEQARLVALLDNLGKGASGAAVQNLNLMLGLDEAAGLA